MTKSWEKSILLAQQLSSDRASYIAMLVQQLSGNTHAPLLMHTFFSSNTIILHLSVRPSVRAGGHGKLFNPS